MSEHPWVPIPHPLPREEHPVCLPAAGAAPMAHPTLPAQPMRSSDGLLGGLLQGAWLPVATQGRMLLAGV